MLDAFFYWILNNFSGIIKYFLSVKENTLLNIISKPDNFALFINTLGTN